MRTLFEASSLNFGGKFCHATGAIFSQMWVEVSGTSAGNVARNLRDQQLGVKGHRDVAIATVLNRFVRLTIRASRKQMSFPVKLFLTLCLC